MRSEEIWRRKSDHELLVASRRLYEYTEEGQKVILAELERRSSPEYMLAQEAAQPRLERTRPTTRARATPRSHKAWLAQRVLLALVLMVGFYVFALGIALMLLWIPYAGLRYLERFNIRIAALCIGGALTVLWALVPRADHFQPPGPQLSESAHPRLFQMIRQVAAATGQAEPADVYLLNEVNAWVTHRGGTMGFGSHRVMGVGLPLLLALSVTEFKAIIAHEFGHYSSGDVQLGPWIYKTRAAIVRTIAGVHTTFIEAPFLWYGRQFLKLTHAVSRQQEFIADQVAAQIAGAAALASALRRMTALAPAYTAYVNGEVVPVLQAGFLPPVAAGFDEFLKAEHVAGASQQIIDAAESEGQTGLFDTHPSLKDRLAALGPTNDSTPSADAREPASTLIAAVDKQARALAEFSFGSDAIRKLKAIDWQSVGDSVYAPGWRAAVTRQSQWLSRYTADGFPVGQHAFIRLGSELVRRDEPNVNTDARIARAVYMLGVGIGVLLLDEGWRVRTSPGRPVLLVRGSDTFDPLAAVRALAADGSDAETWKAQCHALGIAGRPLGARPAIPEAVTNGSAVAITRSPDVAPRAAVDRAAPTQRSSQPFGFSR